ncbi:LytTR family DNA-binding domain-containing protein [Niabella yanshanensis]|uniref:LytTR family DNA-binding domain-containing protein n=1 Tax=Niabella yanshanensis TaxID=577386 RepID=A0ABZ0W4F1_9BACT|nr:LytTR family DNA-binding domain-containing protein [Niabella yanshanensis]WQD38076.1 LytTR family DNA-binding domain-containing protein [Niabella yanshanensis]
MDALIIDDELTARESLKELLAIFCPHVRVTHMAESYQAAIELLQASTPDILFLDISLGKETGFDLLETLESRPTAVIFVTASEQHSLKAFDYAATDYLLKPVSGPRLQKAVEKVARKGTGWIRSEIEDLKNAINGERRISKRLYISTRTGAEIVNSEDLLYIQALGNYVRLVLMDGAEIVTSKLLKQLEDDLAPVKTFLRIHKSFIANLAHIKSIDRSSKGSEVLFINGQSIPCTYFDLLKERLEMI